MSKFLPALVAILMTVGRSLNLANLDAPPSSRTPNIPHKRHSRTRAHRPNDGHWHMRFNRS